MVDRPDAPSDEAVPRERRSVPRYSFTVAIEILEPKSDLRLSGRVSEISRKGCFVDVLNTLPAGTVVRLRMSRDAGTFSAVGEVIHVQEGVGMGVEFKDMPADQLKTLDAWVAELNQ